MTVEERKFLNHLIGIEGYVLGLKAREPGWFYDNFAEFNQLLQQMNNLNTENPEIIKIMSMLQSEIVKAKDLIENPIRTPEEQQFYRHIVGINSYIWETKATNPYYIFDNVPEVDGLLLRVSELETQDPDILAIMNYITKDTKKVIMITKGPEAAEMYQQRLEVLNIGVEEKEKTR